MGFGTEKLVIAASVMCAILSCLDPALTTEVNPDPLGGWHILQGFVRTYFEVR